MKNSLTLGILSIPRAQPNPFLDGQSEAFVEIIETAAQLDCTAFVFGPFDLDWSRRMVWGYRYKPGNSPEDWERQLYPMPSVIYNRIPNRTLENREDIAQVLALLRENYGPRIFNPCFLDKWQTHTILFNNKRIKPFLPETHMLDSPAVISRMLKKHRAIYLKPTASSLGNDIIKVIKEAAGQFRFIHQCLNQEPREGTVNSVNQLQDLLPLFGEPAPYLVQQAIDLARFRGQPFDLRFLVQKNRLGKWCRTGMAARVAGDRSITTHVMYGGARFSAKAAIKQAAENHLFSDALVQERLRTLQFQVPKIIEKAHGHLFGELEMDLGIDTKGNVWFIEANSKPFRFDETLIRSKSLTKLIDYASYLHSCMKNEPAQ